MNSRETGENAPDRNGNAGSLSEYIELVAEEWERRRDHLRMADLPSLVPDSGEPGRSAVLVVLIKIDQEYRWGKGRRPLVEDYLGYFLAPASDETILELLVAECLTRGSLGALPTDSELFSRFPGLAERVDLTEIEAKLAAEDSPALGLLDETGSGETPRSELACTALRTNPPSPLLPGETFGPNDRYEILEELGKGGMATVYLALDTLLRRRLALKVLHAAISQGDEGMKRWLSEAQVSARLRDHPNLCHVYDAGQWNGLSYIALEWVEGESLDEKMAQGEISPTAAARLTSKLAHVLEEVHSVGVVHRDLKPSNVIINSKGEPVLLDFGISKLLDTVSAKPEEETAGAADPALVRFTGYSQLPGTLPWMAPEQLLGKVDARSDVYGLGVMLFQMLTGRLPHASPTLATQTELRRLMDDILHADPGRPDLHNPRIDSALAKICRKAMEKNPKSRYSSIGEMAAAVDSYLQTAGHRKGARRRLAKIVVGLGIVLVTLVVAIVIVRRMTEGSEDLAINRVDVKSNESKVSNSNHKVFNSAMMDAVPSVELQIQKVPSVVSSRIIPSSRNRDVFPGITGIQFGPDSRFAFLSCPIRAESGKSIPWTICAVDLATGESESVVDTPELRLSGAPQEWKGFALAKDGRYAYVTNYYHPYITRFDLHNGNARTDLRTDGQAESTWASWLAIAPDEQNLVVCEGNDGRNENEENDRLSIIDIADGKFHLRKQLPLNDECGEECIAFSQDGKRVYAVTFGRWTESPMVHEINLGDSCRQERTLGLSNAKPRGIAISQRFERAWVGDANNHCLWSIDLKSFSPVNKIELDGRTPDILVINPAQTLLAVVCRDQREAVFVDPAYERAVGVTKGLHEHISTARFAPDGKRLFVTYSKEGAGIEVISVPPEPERIIFSSDRDGEGYRLHAMDLDGGNVRRVIRGSARQSYPRLSPNGRMIAFVSNVSGGLRVCMVTPNCDKPMVFTETDPATVADYRGVPIDWSADGLKIAFVGGQSDAIRVLDVRKNQIVTVHVGPLHSRFRNHGGLSWRGGGDSLFVTSQYSETAAFQEVFRLDVAASRIDLLTTRAHGGATSFAPDVIREGRRIAIIREESPEQRDQRSLFLFDLPEKELVPVSTPEGVRQPASPRWLPDGKYLLCSGSVNGYRHIFRVCISDRRVSQLTKGESNNREPDAFVGEGPGSDY